LEIIAEQEPVHAAIVGKHFAEGNGSIQQGWTSNVSRMRDRRFGWSWGLAVLAMVAVTAAGGAESITNLIGVVLDAEGRPITTASGREEESVLVCGRERKLADGNWDRNHTPHCMLPKGAVDKAGRFTVPMWDDGNTRFNLWVSERGFAPTFVTVMPQANEVKVILKRGVQVSGHVNRRVNGKLEPVQGTNVYLQCASGDLDQQKRVFEDSYWTGVWLKEGDDRPYHEKRQTGALGEYTFQVSPPPKDKKWYLICQDQFVPLEVKEGQPVKGTDFEVTVQVQETGK
jgi:hypothetical protein